MAVPIEELFDCLLSLLQLKLLLMPAKKLRELSGPLNPVFTVPLKSASIDSDIHGRLIQPFNMLQRLLHLVVISEPYHGKRDLFSTVRERLQPGTDAVDRVIVIRCEKHCLLVKKRSDYGIHNGAGLACAGRPLNIGEGMLHGIVDGKELIQIDPPVQKGDRIIRSASRLPEQLSEEGPDGHGGLSLLIHFENGRIFLMQVQDQITAKGNQIGHIVHAVYLFIGVRDPVLDQLPVLFNIRKKFIILRIQKFPYALLIPVYGKFRADRNPLVLPQCPARHIQPQSPIGQHIQSLPGVYTQDIERKLSDPAV